MGGVKSLELKSVSDRLFARSRHSRTSSGEDPNTARPNTDTATSPAERAPAVPAWKEPRRVLRQLLRRRGGRASGDGTAITADVGGDRTS